MKEYSYLSDCPIKLWLKKDTVCSVINNLAGVLSSQESQEWSLRTPKGPKGPIVDP